MPSPRPHKPFPAAIAAVMRETQPPSSDHHITDVALVSCGPTAASPRNSALRSDSQYVHRIECSECGATNLVPHTFLAMSACSECDHPLT